MARYHRNILHEITSEKADRMKVLWEGHPSLFPYLASNKDYFGWLIAISVIIVYDNFQFLMLTKGCIVLFLVYSVYALIQYRTLNYYLTVEGPVVKKGNTYYLLKWEDLRQDEYRIYGRILERLLGCRTFEFTRSYKKSRKKDSWKHTARFWAVKDYQSVEKIVRKYL